MVRGSDVIKELSTTVNKITAIGPVTVTSDTSGNTVSTVNRMTAILTGLSSSSESASIFTNHNAIGSDTSTHWGFSSMDNGDIHENFFRGSPTLNSRPRMSMLF